MVVRPRLKVSWYPFTEHPQSDSCWSVSAGPDGRIYASACAESVPGQTVKVVRYNDKTDSLDYLFDMDQVVDDPRDSGRATQCKIHYSFAPSMSDHILYMASHLSGPPFDMPAYTPWRFWHNEKRCFRGSALVAYDTRGDDVLWWDTLFPKEGCRCLLLDEERAMLYALSYPRDHFFIYDLKTRQRRDKGRIGSINSQVLFLDKHHRVWTADDYGHIVRYDPVQDRMERSPSILPHNPKLESGWHCLFYDAVSAPDSQSVYASTWIGSPRLMRIWLYDGPWGRVEDLGPLTQEYDDALPVDTFLDHAGGLVFGADGKLYFVASRWQDPVPSDYMSAKGIVWRLDPETLQREEVAELRRPNAAAHYVSRGAINRQGDLFFGHVNELASARPVGIFRVEMPEDKKKRNAHLPIRAWG